MGSGTGLELQSFPCRLDDTRGLVALVETL
jgi:hypothetical protein